MTLDPGELLGLVLPQVTPYIGSAGGGSYSFQLLCSYKACRRMDSISPSRLTIRSEKHKRIAAEKFVARGWGYSEWGPICPDCRRSLPASPGMAFPEDRCPTDFV